MNMKERGRKLSVTYLRHLFRYYLERNGAMEYLGQEVEAPEILVRPITDKVNKEVTQ
jgi:hypothetical protein